MKSKSCFKNVKTISPFYTFGPVSITQNGQNIITCVDEEILYTQVSTGRTICRFSSDTEPITALTLTPSSSHLLVFTSSLSLRIFQLPTSTSPSSTGPPPTIHPTRVIARAHDSPVHVCISDPISTYLASGSADGVVKVWHIHQGYITHIFKGHGGVVSALAFHYPQNFSSLQKTDEMWLFTASVDTRIRVFELLKEPRSTKPVAVLEGHVSVPRGLDVSSCGSWLVSGGRDSVVLVWDLGPLRRKHGSEKGKGRGKDGSSTPILAKTIPVLERVEAVGLLPAEGLGEGPLTADNLRLFTGGASGIIKIWNAKQGTVEFSLGQQSQSQPMTEEMEEQRQIIHALYLPEPQIILSIHADQNILFYSLQTRSLTRQLIGYNDEIVDSAFLSPSSASGSRDTHIALSTNSSLIRVYSTSTYDARLLSGHTDIVLCLDTGIGGRVLASGGKDNTARVWTPSSSDDGWSYQCIATCQGHAESVGAIALPHGSGGENQEEEGAGTSISWMFTASSDRTIKMWDLSPVSFSPSSQDMVKCSSLMTHRAHEKDINSLDISPNDRLLASGSQDRTAKIFEIEYSHSSSNVSTSRANGSIKLLGTLKGHKRGIWSVKFSKHSRVVLTGSGDKSVKLWNLEDFSCVRTFEGHTGGVLRVDFLGGGVKGKAEKGEERIVTSGSDGLVKVWNSESEECLTTLDGHEGKVWALAVTRDGDTVVSGGTDSVVRVWEDVTEEEEEKEERRREEEVEKEQAFQNYLSLHDYRKAIELSLALAQPGRLLSLFKQVASSSPEISSPTSYESSGTPTAESSLTGSLTVDTVLRTLSPSDLSRLLGYIKDWNANGKTSDIAQKVLYALFKLRPVEEVIGAFNPASVAVDLDGVGFGESTEGSTSRMGMGSLDKIQGGLKEWVDGFIPYSERHLGRVEKLIKESYVVDFILAEMDGGIFGQEGETEMDFD